jgi:hypothetical protein
LDVQDREIRIDRRLIRLGYIDGEGFQFLKDPEAAIRTLRESRPGIDIFTFIQKLSETTPKYSFPTESDNFAVLPITTFDDWMKHQIDFKVRNKIRKAEKNGVRVREVPFDDSLIRAISVIYNESPIRQGKRFWHYGKDLETLRKMKATFLERSIFIGAFYQETMIGFVKLVASEDYSQAGTMHIISMVSYRDRAATNALIAQAVRSCADRKIPLLWYANMLYGNKERDPLADFKRHNGFQKVDIPRYFVPLTLAGRVGLRLGLHRGLNSWVPESLARRYRSLRSEWYARRLPTLEKPEQDRAGPVTS